MYYIHVYIINMLCVCYQDGIIIDRNEEMAVKYYKLAAEQGFAKASYNLG